MVRNAVHSPFLNILTMGTIETIKTADWSCAWLFGCKLKARVYEFSLYPIGCTSAPVCDVQRRCRCSIGYKCHAFTFFLPLTAFLRVPPRNDPLFLSALVTLSTANDPRQTNFHY